MKTLVVLASYGHANDRYLERVLAEYRLMGPSIDIIVTSDIPRDLGPDIRVIVGLPDNNPLALPFAHKQVFAERLNEYDLFIYSEDDILITWQNIQAFLEVTKVLPHNNIVGFVRSEVDPAGNRYYDPLLSHFHWDSTSLCTVQGYTFARFTNQHSGCFILTREQLKRFIASGGFLVEPHEGAYELREAAATDPYTQCGLEQRLCISHLDRFTVLHLPANKYGSRPYRGSIEFHRQIEALLGLEERRRPKGLLFQPETRVLYGKWSKDYYEPVRPEVTALVPESVHRILSIGCGWGETEGWLIQRGARVVAIPMDSVIAACAEARGVEIVYGDFQMARNAFFVTKGSTVFYCRTYFTWLRIR